VDRTVCLLNDFVLVANELFLDLMQNHVNFVKEDTLVRLVLHLVVPFLV